ncbi:hypothetical protein BC940DRAFT_335697 [Gongronella butleri]|nr:hypothetical protein BC940DRAFT_335697 [Gongronella butleri]
MDKVIIIGGGLAGLSLAVSLKHHGIPFQLFERDAQADGRLQGWSISMHFGWHWLKRVLSDAQIAAMPRTAVVDVAHPDASIFTIIDFATGEKVVQLPPVKPEGEPLSYRINRRRFRSWLIDNLDKDDIVWGKRLEGYTLLDGNDGVEARFDDGTTVRGAMLVGADGVRSKVCEQLLGNEVFAKETIVNPVEVLVCVRWVSAAEWDPVEKMYSQVCMGYGRGTCVFSTLNDIDHENHPERPFQVLCSVSNFDVPKETIGATDEEKINTAKQWLVDGQMVVDNPIINLVRNMSLANGVEIHHLTVRERVPNHDILKATDGRVTVIGDACHPMTMYRGEGGNHAVMDAVLLANALAEAKKKQAPLTDAIQPFLSETIPRGVEAVEQSSEAARLMHRDPEAMINAILQRAEPRIHQFSRA